jgi:DNA-binding NarL/FixJ family response regulator
MSHRTDIKIILADDHEIVRVGLKRLFSMDKQIFILGEASNGNEAIDLVKYYQPDIALLDIMMPVMDGIEATRSIKEFWPDVFCVILTAFEDSQHIEKAMDAGANGYLSKDIGAKELIDAIYRVVKGERVFSKSILSLLQKKYFKYQEKNEPGSVAITKREQEIIDFVAKGMSSPQIAEKLCISVRTVQTHRANIMKKLDVSNSAGLVRYALWKNNL